MDSKDLHILCVDDEPEILDMMSGFCEKMGFGFLGAESCDQAFDLLNKHRDTIIFVASDYKMPEKTGLDLRDSMQGQLREIPFAIISGFITKELALEGLEKKICAFIDKPIEYSQFQEVITKEAEARISTIEENIEIRDCFFEEAEEIMQELEPLILSLETDPHNSDTINAIFRLVHTLKGGSGVLDVEAVTAFIHTFEDTLLMTKEGKLSLIPEVIGVFLKTCDVTNMVLEKLRRNQFSESLLSDVTKDLVAIKEGKIAGARPAAPTEAAAESAAEAGKQPTAKQESIVVPTSMLDEFMHNSGEITVIRNMVNKLVKSIERNLPGDEDVNLLGELLEEMHKINSTMQNQITELRKIPMSSVLKRVPRTVRDLSKQLNKKVNLNIEGENLRVDTAIASGLAGCFTHIIRNSLDHGIEGPEERLAQNKPETGEVRLTCSEDNEFIYVTIEDDGKGIDPNKIRDKLISNGNHTEAEIEFMPEKELFKQIFEPGFSTAAEVTDVSGRGVGMDMVKNTITDMRGKIDVESSLGVGTKISLVMPIPKSVVIINSLLVAVGEEVFAVPQDNVNRLLKLNEEQRQNQLKDMEGGLVFQLGDELLPIVNLGNLLGVECGEDLQGDWNLVILSGETTKLALHVDSIIDSEDIVVKSLHENIQDIGLYQGATFLGDGTIGLIIDVNGLIEAAGVNVSLIAGEQIVRDETAKKRSELLLFGLGSEGNFAVELSKVYRLEKFEVKNFQTADSHMLIPYRDSLMPIIPVQDYIGMHSEDRLDAEVANIVVVKYRDKFFGLRISEIRDVLEIEDVEINEVGTCAGIIGSSIIAEKVVSFVSMDDVIESYYEKNNHKEAA